MPEPKYKIGDSVYFYGDLATIVEVDERTYGEPTYFLTVSDVLDLFDGTFHTWADEVELNSTEDES